MTFRPGRIVLPPMLCLALLGCSAISMPVSNTKVAGFVTYLADELAATPEPLAGVLSVDDAVRRAMRHNQTVRAKELEATLAEAKVHAQAGAMLPNIVAESDYYRRDRPHMSHSNQSSTFSTSSDLQSTSRSIAVSWNILDFGLSYVRTRQGLDRAMQQQEEVDRVRARIAEETRAVYWKAVALERLGKALGPLDRDVEAALAVSRTASRDPLIDPLASINFQRDILNARRDLNGLQASLAGAVDQLKQLIGLPHHASMQLDSGARARVTLPSSSVADDVALALRQRPEIRQHLYDLRITEDEVNVTILQLLPDFTLSKSFASDTNSHLLHANWISWGAKIAGNLIDLVRLPANLGAVDAQHRAHRQSALATAATIAMQVHVARARMAVHARAHRDALQFAEVQQQLLQQVRTTVRLGRVGRQAIAREQLATVLAEIRAVVAFADLHAAAAGYATAMGNAALADRAVVENGWNRIVIE